MKHALRKDMFREIRHTFSRFLSIFFIVLLGVSFFAGIKATCPNMKSTADKYYDDHLLMDIRIVSTMGLSDSDVSAVRTISGTDLVFPSYSMDVILNLYNWDYVVKVIALEDESSPSYTGINGVHLIEGRMPLAPNECLVEPGHDIYPDMPVGSVLSLKSGTDKDLSEDLENTEFTVVGIVVTPYYITTSRGMSGIGGGSVNSFIMIPKNNFKLDIYTDIFMTVKNAREQQCYEDGYSSVVKPVVTALEDISDERQQARYKEITDEANEKLNESKEELAEAEEKQRTELSKAKRELDDAWEEITDGENEIAASEASLKKAIRKGKDELKAGYAALAEGEKQYREQYDLYLATKAQADILLPAAEAQIEAGEKQIAENEALLELLRYQFENDLSLSTEQKEVIQVQISMGEKQLEDAKVQLEAGKAEIIGQKDQLEDAKMKLEAGKMMLEAGEEQLRQGEVRIAKEGKKARRMLAEARVDIAEAKKKYADGQKEYESSKKESDEEIADARQKIADAQEDISEIKQPQWYVLNREDNNPGYADYGETANTMNAIAQIFPVFFILVTMLVCLTTMTRMVDEQRTYIGTLKALGYTKTAIAAKYIVYAALASTAGSVSGVFLGFSVFPTVIGSAYGMMYTMPPMQTGFYASYAAISILFAILTTTVSAWFACYKELREAPAVLMRPKSPKPGKRVFLERFGFIWSRLKFSTKITVRNLFRYKRRFFMTVIGIAGCMALVLSAFGLRDSISTIGEKQFVELDHSDMIIALKDEDESISSVSALIQNDQRITELMSAKEQVATVSNGDKKQDAGIFVPESAEKLKLFKTLRDRNTGEELEMTDDGAILTEKLSMILDVSVGDTVNIEDGDHNKGTVRVLGIAEYYVGHAVYMSPAVYESVFGKQPVYRQIITLNTSTETEFENALSADLLKEDSVSAIGFYKYIKQDFDKGIQSLYYVVLVLIVSAGLLAIVVLYNLTNINIMERIREIATIKVLGFYNLEVSAYVFWENAILTFLGIGAGAALGYYLHSIVVVAAESKHVMFGREIFFSSYIYAFLVTAFFMLIVNFIMFFRLKKINMVESLKSVD